MHARKRDTNSNRKSNENERASYRTTVTTDDNAKQEHDRITPHLVYVIHGHRTDGGQPKQDGLTREQST